jgi:2'-5' RNA ligase
VRGARNAIVERDEERLFFALWPPLEVARALHGWAADVRRGAGGRAIPAANIHLTLAFLGELDPARARDAEQAGEAVRAGPFALEFDEGRYWAHNRIVWAGPSRPPQALLALVRRLCAALAEAGFKTDDRPYQAHFTLLRDAGPPSAFAAPASQAMRVEEFVLARSELSPRGPSYSVRRRFPLLRPRQD